MKTRIDFTCAPFHHNLQLSTPNVYSGKFVVRVHQWGVLTLDSDTGETRMISPVGKIDPVFQRPAIAVVGDCWASATRVAATPGAPKWIVLIGTPPMCAASGTPEPAENVQVLRLDGGAGLLLVGQVHAPLVNRVSSPLVLNGDVCYAPEGLFPSTLFTKIDLNLMAVLGTSVPLPSGVVPPQPDIQGYTYELHQVTQQTFYAERIGGVPVPGLPTYCPNDFVNRGQMAVFLLKTKYGSTYAPPPATGTMFSDVPITHQFAAWIEQLAKDGITAGKAPCQS